MRRLLTTISLLTCCLTFLATTVDDRDAVGAALARIDAQIAHAQQTGDAGQEGVARWQRLVTLKNDAQADVLSAEIDDQMAWFRRHGQWDAYYRSWQMKANTLCMQGKLQTGLQETQHLLSDASARGNKLGRAMAYKQIGVIYLNMKQTGPAVEALRHYATLMKDEDDTGTLSNIYYRIAKAHDYDRAYDEELRVTDEWLAFLRDKAKDKDRADYMELYNACFLARAAAYIGRQQSVEARQALDSASRYAHRSNTTLSLHHFYKMQARYFLSQGDAAQTLRYTDSVRQITSEKDNRLAELQAQALLLQGRGSEAAQIYQRLYHEKDSVFGIDARQHLDELNTLFQVDELKTEQQRTKFRYTLLTAVSVVLALLLLLFYGWRNTVRQKRANEQLRQANERAKASSKMKSEFIRNISHEIRTPLNIVSGFTQILTTPDMELPEDEKRDIRERITENTDRITKLVDRMLELSDANSETVIGRSDQTDVLSLTVQAIERSRIRLHTRPGKAEAAVTFEFPHDEHELARPLLTNQRYAVRALSQLLENALKFTKEGRITLRVACTDTHVRFTVEDTGIGIPADQQEHIFDEFVQLDEFADGTGIGLTVARSLARRMGGDLWLDGSQGTGACFLLELPRT